MAATGIAADHRSCAVALPCKLDPGKLSTKSLRDIYADDCQSVGCKRNSELMRTLPSSPGDFASLECLDLNLNCVGKKGVRALFNVMTASPNLRSLLLADNFLTNDSVRDLLENVSGHPALERLDLTRNPISHSAGKYLSEHVSSNARLCDVGLADTLINPALVKIIERKAAANRTAALGGIAAAPPLATKSHSGRARGGPSKRVRDEESTSTKLMDHFNSNTAGGAAEGACEECPPAPAPAAAAEVQEPPPPAEADAKPAAAAPQQKEAPPAVRATHLMKIFDICRSEPGEYEHLQLVSVIAAETDPDIIPLERKAAPQPADGASPAGDAALAKEPVPAVEKPAANPPPPPQQEQEQAQEKREPASPAFPEDAAPAAPQALEDSFKERQLAVTVDLPDSPVPIADEEEWYGVKLLYNASLVDDSQQDGAWYGIRGVFAAVSLEGGAEEAGQHEALATAQFEPADSKPSDARSVERSSIVQEVEPQEGPLELCRQAATVDHERDIIAFLLQPDGPRPPLRLKNLEVLFETADRMKDETTGLDYLRRSLERMTRPQQHDAFNGSGDTWTDGSPDNLNLTGPQPATAGGDPSTGNQGTANNEVSSQSPSGSSARGSTWYALELVWRIASSKIDEGGATAEKDWGALSSVMSIVNKKNPSD
ncbi:putative serine/threonine-protein kinase roco5 [Diplonema papillatum]|nr:putative serine/threonine-protein kinase roco5 [Diplonema papillatum]